MLSINTMCLHEDYTNIDINLTYYNNQLNHERYKATVLSYTSVQKHRSFFYFLFFSWSSEKWPLW